METLTSLLNIIVSKTGNHRKFLEIFGYNTYQNIFLHMNGMQSNSMCVDGHEDNLVKKRKY